MTGKTVLGHFDFWEISFSTEGKVTNLHILIPFVSVVSLSICQKETGRGRWASTNGLEEGGVSACSSLNWSCGAWTNKAI